MRRPSPLAAAGLAVAAVAAAGCGSSERASPTTTVVASSASAVGPGAHTLFRGTSWAVVVGSGKAVALHLSRGRWLPDRTGRVKVEILGPPPGATAAATPQVAAQLTSKTDLVESALWVDGRELIEKGGGTPTRGTIYGAPEQPLQPGTHTAVAYGRTATAGTAVAWRFTVR